MPTNVLPTWVKSLLLILCLAVSWWSFADRKEPPQSGNYLYLTSGKSGSNRGFPAKAEANIRQFATNPLEPTPLPEEETVILQAPDANYYRDQP